MQKIGLNKWKLPLAALLTAAIFLRPQTAVDAARDAMAMWYGSVAPAIFPFMALMPLLTSPEACAVYEQIFSPVMGRVFRLPGAAAPAMIIGMIAGSPAGAAAIAATAGHSSMTKARLRRFAPVICGVGPSYLVMGVGIALYGSAKIGLRLAAVYLFVQLLMLFLMGFLPDKDREPVAVVSIESARGMSKAVEGVLVVCGYMVVFSVAASVLSEFAGKIPGRFILLASDLPSGMGMLSRWDVSGREILLGIAVGFSGLCMIAQNMQLLEPIGLRWKDMLCVKFAQSALCGALFPLFLRTNRSLPFFFGEKSAAFYVASLLIALILCIPVLISLSNKLFLNKIKSAGTFSG